MDKAQEITVYQLATILSLNPYTLRSWIKQGKIKAVKRGNTYFIPVPEHKEVNQNFLISKPSTINKGKKLHL